VKVAIGTRLQEGPWGGGNQFAVSLSAHLARQGHDVGFALDRNDLDVVLLTEPRRTSATSALNDVDIWTYLVRVNSQAIVVHRINECDERKGTRWVNRRLALANRCADHTVFISSWLRGLFAKHGWAAAHASVILNGAERSVFHPADGPPWDGQGRLRVVTHHWGDHWNKGFDVYGRFDALLGRDEFRDRFAFTYVGRVPPGFTFRHATVVPPLSGRALGDELRRHDAYLTASVNEPAGMHHIEGALCGLPLLYRRSGALPEYCSGFGLAFDENTFEPRLLDLRERFAGLKAHMPAYPHDAGRMCRAYEALCQELLADRRRIVGNRRWSTIQARRNRAAGQVFDALMRITTRGTRFVRGARR
jgi:hypothetical protein